MVVKTDFTIQYFFSTSNTAGEPCFMLVWDGGYTRHKYVFNSSSWGVISVWETIHLE